VTNQISIPQLAMMAYANNAAQGELARAIPQALSIEPRKVSREATVYASSQSSRRFYSSPARPASRATGARRPVRR